MIVCHRHRFIFIKTRKTAGSSIEIALSRACRPGDIVTPLSERLGEDDVRRAEGGYGPAGWEKPISAHRTIGEWYGLLFRGRRAEVYREHATAEELQRLLPPEVWSNYFKFSIERNPWDRAVSRYYWQKYRWERRGRSNFPSISEYLQWMEREKPHWISNWSHYAVGDTIAVDRVLAYETISGDLQSLKTKLGINEDISLPTTRAKGGFRQDRRHYSEILSEQDKVLIERLCAREIQKFGYRFEARATPQGEA